MQHHPYGWFLAGLLVSSSAFPYQDIGNMPIQLAVSTETGDYLRPNTARGNEGKLALYDAVLSNNIKTVQILLESGVTGVNDFYGAPRQSLLSIASWSGDSDMVRLLLKHGADLSVIDPDGRDALAGAIAIGSVETLHILLEAGADPNRRLPDGLSAVSRAAIHGRAELLKLILENKGDIDFRDNEGNTLLIYASALAREEAVRLLLERGASTYPLNSSQTSALGAAKRVEGEARERLVVMLRASGAKDGDPLRPIDDAFLKATYAGDLNKMKALLAQGADLHARGKLSSDFVWIRNALSASVKHPKICEFLIKQKINIHMGDEGFTALHTAARDGVPETIQILVSQGLDPNARSKRGDTPLFQAMNAQPKTANVAMLLKLGADPNGTTFSGQPLINFARERKFRQIVDLLERAGAEAVNY